MIASYKPLIYRKLTAAAITSGIAAFLFAALWSQGSFKGSVHLYLLYGTPIFYLYGFTASFIFEVTASALFRQRPFRMLLSGLLHAVFGYLGLLLLFGLPFQLLGEIGLYSALLYYFIDIVLDNQLRKHTLKGAIGSFIFGPVILFFVSIVWINL